MDGISLEDVAGTAADTPATQSSAQAIAALVSLGYSQSEAALAIAKIDATLPVEEIIKLALAQHGRQEVSNAGRYRAVRRKNDAARHDPRRTMRKTTSARSIWRTTSGRKRSSRT